MSCVPVSIVGARFAMSLDPFWEPVQYSELNTAIPRPFVFIIPTQFLSSGCSVATRFPGSSSQAAIYCANSSESNSPLSRHRHVINPLRHSISRDKVEMYLAFGATRAEASKPIVIEALRLALMPTINQMR